MREIYKRKAEVQNDDIIVKPFIPPQYFARYTALNWLCKERRESDPKLKTQLRFCHKGIEILTKYKGENEPFRAVNMAEFIGNADIPGYDASIKWRIQTDRRPRNSRIQRSSQEEAMEDDRIEEVEEHPNMMRRQRSVGMGGDNMETKRQKVTALIEVEVDGSFQTGAGRQNLEDIL